MARPVRRSEIEELVVSIRRILDDPDADMNEPMRRHWEGSLAALDVILGRRSFLVDNLGLFLL